MFTLLICHTFTLGLCNSYVQHDYPTEAQCYRAAEFYLKTAPKRPESIVCTPKREEKAK